MFYSAGLFVVVKMLMQRIHKKQYENDTDDHVHNVENLSPVRFRINLRTSGGYHDRNRIVNTVQPAPLFQVSVTDYADK